MQVYLLQSHIMTISYKWSKHNPYIIEAMKKQIPQWNEVIPYCQNSSPLLLHCSVSSQMHIRWKNENMKWNSHIKYLRSKPNTSYYMIGSLKNVMSPYIIRTMYFECFHVHLRYGLVLCGSDHESKRIFQFQKKLIVCSVK